MKRILAALAAAFLFGAAATPKYTAVVTSDAAGSIHHGDTVTFTATTDAPEWLFDLRCKYGRDVVITEGGRHFTTPSASLTVTLRSPSSTALYESVSDAVLDCQMRVILPYTRVNQITVVRDPLDFAILP